MLRILPALLLLTVSGSALAQAPGRRRPVPAPQVYTFGAETAINQAMEQLAEEKKAYERDIAILRHLQSAEEALTDPMQPAISVQKAFEGADEANRLGSSDYLVRDGIIRLRRALDDARKSPGTADFERLRSLLRSDAIGPASRVAARNALQLQEETIAWLRIQQRISEHLKNLSEIGGESLRESQK
jgi:hypothetical protein